MPVEDKIAITDPSSGKLYVDVTRSNLDYYNGDWFGFRFNDEIPVYGVNMDTLMVNSVRIKLVKSKDSSYHLNRVRLSQGNTRELATKTAEKIHFAISQQDTVLNLPEGFAVSSTDKFRNQQVLLIIEVPVGKRIQMDESLNHYDWFNINVNNRRGWNIDFDEYNDQSYSWEANKEYIMTPDGLKKVSDLDPVELKSGRFKIIVGTGDDKVQIEGEFDNNKSKNHYRYKQLEDSIKEKVKDKLREELRVKDSIEREKKLKEIIKTNAVNTKEKNREAGEEPLTTGHILSPVFIFSEMFN
jgi:uncharacterized protein YjbJ (UPF0337 family)